MSSFDLEGWLDHCRYLTEECAEKYLPGADKLPACLYESMRYSFFAGGKRVRPALSIGAATAVGGDVRGAVLFGAALELIHTYSLIHDDLPAMDDDSLRRGKPTNHVIYGDAIAILAGDGLLTDAFAIASGPEALSLVGAERALRCVGIMAHGAGSLGMVAGQALDMVSEGRKLDIATLEFLHTHKTGALIRAAVHVGAVAAGAGAEEEKALLIFADRLGLAFQIADDILDVEGEEEKLGKPIGSDEGNDKATYPALIGLSESKRRLTELTDEAIAALSRFGGKGEPLAALARYIAYRDH